MPSGYVTSSRSSIIRAEEKGPEIPMAVVYRLWRKMGSFAAGERSPDAQDASSQILSNEFSRVIITAHAEWYQHRLTDFGNHSVQSALAVLYRLCECKCMLLESQNKTAGRASAVSCLAQGTLRGACNSKMLLVVLGQWHWNSKMLQRHIHK